MSVALAIDVGNTNTVFGILSLNGNGEVIRSWRTVTRRDRTSDELGVFLMGFFETTEHNIEDVTDCIYSSVVPSFNPIVERMVEDHFHVKALRTTYELDLPIIYDYPRPYEIGADRIVNAVAVWELYKRDAIIIDLGTATTFCIMHGNSYQGGVIAPGVKLAMETLTKSTSLLPSVEFGRPSSGIIADSTVHAIQSGFFFGWVGLLRGIISEIQKTNPNRDYLIIATGGLSRKIHEEVNDLFDVVDNDLTLKGLRMILLRNRSQLDKSS